MGGRLCWEAGCLAGWPGMCPKANVSYPAQCGTLMLDQNSGVWSSIGQVCGQIRWQPYHTDGILLSRSLRLQPNYNYSLL